MNASVPNPLETLTLDALRRRTSEKWRHYPADILPLWVAEMDVVPPEPVIEAVHAAMTLGDTGYPSGDAYPRALSRFASDRWGWAGLDPERMLTVPDVMTGLVAAVEVLTERDDAVVVCSPVYPPFYGYMSQAGRRVLEALLTDDGRLDPEAVRAALTEARSTTRQPVLLLSNPHNPTGVAHTREELTAVAAVARELGARVVADEIHSPLVLNGADFTPFLSVPGAENAFAVFSASKAWNLAGLKAAVLSAGPEAAADLRRVPWTVNAGVSHVAVIAHCAALEHGVPWLDALLSGLEQNRDLVASLVEEHLPGVTMNRPQATYLAWLDCRALDLPPAEAGSVSQRFDLAGPAAFFFDHAHVGLNDGARYGSGGEGFVRLNFGTSSAVLREAFERMGRALRAR
ncbi:aminotransferase class I/II-fold pyridoxal phosphate-dependent enzyme [Kocuria sp. JC486]|uniref:MalY/PatB family protein n=1 Tax=Kocuria sp. JC486 TaxID=1970736 RepID=UPI0014236BCD|nr:aminotransferase class I/II-fold pyridoxal phosphate-dependent enzyme [Kocuria sp. JC486]NHU84186.1 aminotransferase class I/II-fold pyridoxal phosphate-dependent enzyme [Kocuria sp. JC486]